MSMHFWDKACMCCLEKGSSWLCTSNTCWKSCSCTAGRTEQVVFFFENSARRYSLRSRFSRKQSLTMATSVDTRFVDNAFCLRFLLNTSNTSNCWIPQNTPNNTRGTSNKYWSYSDSSLPCIGHSLSRRGCCIFP